MFKKSLVLNFVRMRWVELYLAPGSWSGLFRTIFCQVLSFAYKQAHSLTPWLSPGSRILTVFYPQNHVIFVLHQACTF